MINWELIKHPANWLIVILMLVIAGAAGHFALAYFGAELAGPKNETGSAQEYPAVPDRNEIALDALG